MRPAFVEAAPRMLVWEILWVIGMVGAFATRWRSFAALTLAVFAVMMVDLVWTFIDDIGRST